jgi:hypothetical protein
MKQEVQVTDLPGSRMKGNTTSATAASCAAAFLIKCGSGIHPPALRAVVWPLLRHLPLLRVRSTPSRIKLTLQEQQVRVV